MTEADDIQQALESAFAEFGLSPEAAAGLAEFVGGLVEMRLRAVVAEKFSALRRTVFGEALFRELAGEDPRETAAAAARRLHCNPRVLRRERERIRELLGNPVRPHAKVEAA